MATWGEIANSLKAVKPSSQDSGRLDSFGKTLLSDLEACELIGQTLARKGLLPGEDRPAQARHLLFLHFLDLLCKA